MSDNRSDWGSMDILDTLAVIGEESLLSDLRWHRTNIRATLHLIRALRAWKVACARSAEEPAAVAAEVAPIYRSRGSGSGSFEFWRTFRRVKEFTGADKPVILGFLRDASYQLVQDMTDDDISVALTNFIAEGGVDGSPAGETGEGATGGSPAISAAEAGA